jgi:hypothetical protein
VAYFCSAAHKGRQFTWVGFDELTQWRTLYPWRYLRGRLRSAHKVPTKRMRGAGNPGGPGHLEVKAYFIDPAPTGFTPILDPETNAERMFIPARLSDNRALTANDAEYADRLRGLGGQLAKAMLEGDWNIIEGAYFDGWSARNIVRPFAIPDDWTRFRSFDWGSARPFSVGWWAVCSDPTEAEDGAGQRIVIPRGAMIRYREWYGSNGKPNEGLKLTAEAVAEGIVERERGENIAYGVADPAIFSSDGGPAIAERMHRAKCHWRRADNARVSRGGAMGGWDVMRARIQGDEDGPQLVVFSIRACDQHASVKWEAGSPMSNQSLRIRFGLPEKQYPQVSIVIREAIEAGVIRPQDEDQGNRNARYVPSWV